MRAMLREETVEDYAEQMELAGGWGPYPPIEVVYDGETYYLTDGFHRTSAARRHFNEDFEVPAIVTPGTYKDALMAAARANDKNGLQRSRADKRRAVTRIMQEPEWAALGDSKIADMCAVTPRFVGQMRAEMVKSGAIQPVTTRQGRDGRITNVANIGRQRKPATNGAATPTPTPTPTQEPLAAPEPPAEEVVSVATEIAPHGVSVATPQPVDKPSQLIFVTHKRGSAQRIYEALVAGALRNYLTPAENDYELKAFAKSLNEGVLV